MFSPPPPTRTGKYLCWSHCLRTLPSPPVWLVTLAAATEACWLLGRELSWALSTGEDPLLLPLPLILRLDILEEKPPILRLGAGELEPVLLPVDTGERTRDVPLLLLPFPKLRKVYR